MTQVVFMTVDSSSAAAAGQPPFDELPDRVAERASSGQERSTVRDRCPVAHRGGIGRRRTFVNRMCPLVK
jgi:hypothetical protein